jgi:uncharacterized membrane protein
MAFCANCGSAVEGKFCAKCGSSVGATGPTPGAGGGAAASQASGMTDNVVGLLCYVLGIITGIIFLVVEPYNRNRFVRFHAWQSIFFGGAMFGLYVAQMILGFILPFLVTSLLWTLISLGGLAVWILLMVKAYNNERFKLPVIGDLAEKQS